MYKPNFKENINKNLDANFSNKAQEMTDSLLRQIFPKEYKRLIFLKNKRMSKEVTKEEIKEFNELSFWLEHSLILSIEKYYSPLDWIRDKSY
jgi:hypothetical protein